MDKDTIKSTIAAGILGASLLTVGLSGSGEPVDEVFIIVPVEEMKLNYWEDAKQDPRTVIYTDDADSFVVSFDSNDIPSALEDITSYNADEIEQVRDNPEGLFKNRLEIQE